MPEKNETVELRVHGVGGPQAPKMLGLHHETDVATLPPFTVGNAQVPFDADSRFVRPLANPAGRPREAYEWGGLTTGSLWKALWVAFLPFTVLNVAGWARTSHGLSKNRRRWRDLGTRLLAHLGTVTYVLWAAYIFFELLGLQWRRRLDAAAGTTDWFANWLVAPVVIVLFVALVGGMVYANVRSGRQFEQSTPDRTDPPPDVWSDDETAVHPDFFAHSPSAERLRRHHLFTGALACSAALVLAACGVGKDHSHLGLAIVVLATVQVGVLALVCLVDLVRSVRRGVVPAQRAGLLTLGTVLCHAAFAGGAMWLRERLATIPGGGSTEPLPVGPELAFGAHLAVALAIVAVAGLALAFWPGGSATADGRPVRAARRVPLLGIVVSLSFIGIFGGFSAWQTRGEVWERCAKEVGGLGTMRCWYDNYRVGESETLEDLGAKVLLAFPALFALSLRSTTPPAKVLGNAWDVLTFWPRRYHPFAVPPYAERAVPELRARIDMLRKEGGVIVSAHSQGSVIAVAALGPVVKATDARVHLVTFGSPLGPLIARVFPAAMGRAALDEVRADLGAAGRRWWLFWRKTDPIGGPLFGSANPDEHCLVDPPAGAGWTVPSDLLDLPPLDRPPAWGVTRGHGSYPADPAYQQAIAEARADLANR